MEKKILAGFSGEDFNDATSSRFDGGDGSFPENLQEKKTISPSAEGQHDETGVESDDCSQVCHLKKVTN